MNSTGSASTGFDISPRTHYILYVQKNGNGNLEGFLEKIREIEKYRRRQEAHQEIDSKRGRVNVVSLLQQFDTPKNKITIDKTGLLEVLNTYPEDD